MLISRWKEYSKAQENAFRVDRTNSKTRPAGLADEIDKIREDRFGGLLGSVSGHVIAVLKTTANFRDDFRSNFGDFAQSHQQATVFAGDS
jgi:hypothetical protein